MKLYHTKVISLGVILLCFFLDVHSQELVPHRLSLEEAIDLGLKNHQQLKISVAQIESSEQQVKVSKLQQLPSISFSANAFYLGDVMILDSDWSKVQSIEMPNFGNTFGLQATQLLYKGGVIKKSIEMSELQQQLAELDLVNNEQDIKFLITSNYLDICKLINQTQVLEQNKVLAEQLLANVSKLFEEDMVTRNEIIRAELQIKNLDQTILSIKNNHAILSNQLSYALGLSNDILIIPTDETNDYMNMKQEAYFPYLSNKHPYLLLAEKNVEIAEKNISIQRSNWSPSISAIAGYNMQRPLTSSTPVIDMYNNSWQVGINLSFNIDNLYKIKKHVNLSKSQARVAHEALIYTKQNIEIGISAAYLKYQESEQQVVLMDESRYLANENYNIVLNKYLNQLAITAEMTDASNTKLKADLEYENAVINALFQYFNLIKSTGNL